ILSVDSNSGDGSSFADQQANDYYNIQGTSMASPFTAGCAALVIDALQQRGVAWDFTSSARSRYVKMILCATATETNATRENNSNNPTLERASSGSFPAGKDMYEGYGIINPDAAVEAAALTYLRGQTIGDTLGSSIADRRAWARRITLTAGQTFVPTLTNPAGGDYDLYLYSATPAAYGTPVIEASGTSAGNGGTETFSYSASSTGDHLLVAKRVAGSGAFSLTSPAPSTVIAASSPAPNFTLYDWNVSEGGKMLALAFRVTDPGGDGYPTKIDRLTVKIGGTAGHASNDIAWAELRDSTNRLATAASISNSQIVFGSAPNSDSAAQLDTVADNSCKGYTVYVYLAASLQGANGQTYSFDMDETCVGVDTASGGTQMSADTGAVTAVVGTLFVTQLGVSISPLAWTIGPTPLNAAVVSGAFSATNSGNLSEDFTIKGTDGAGGWLLQSAPGVNAYRVEMDKGRDGSYEFALTKSDQTLAQDMATSGAQTFGLRYSAPTSDTLGAAISQGFIITIKASRHVP
ncbi:MAG: S8 family serine peptidase, partial [Candidatus Sumerlaeota bacterium]|nr:S8 family serine peptidase [Candidatus Sumerlaeota bacterium]